jgi:hypothetical protein
MLAGVMGTLQIYIWDMPGLNLCHDTSYPQLLHIPGQYLN